MQILLEKQRNNFRCDAVSGDETCKISEKKSDISLRTYFSTSKPELGLILQGNGSILA